MTQQEVDFLLGIEARDGKWVPETIVNEARDPACPVHGQFIWDDAVAAHAQRITTAQHLINALPKVQYRVRDGGMISAPLAVRDPRSPAGEKAYVRTTLIKTDAAHAKETLVSVIARVTNALATATSLAVALGLEGQVAEVKASVADLLRDLDAVPLREAA